MLAFGCWQRIPLTFLMELSRMEAMACLWMQNAWLTALCFDFLKRATGASNAIQSKISTGVATC